jgi:hypothetical protein
MGARFALTGYSSAPTTHGKMQGSTPGNENEAAALIDDCLSTATG